MFIKTILFVLCTSACRWTIGRTDMGHLGGLSGGCCLLLQYRVWGEQKGPGQINIYVGGITYNVKNFCWLQHEFKCEWGYWAL